MIQVAAFLIENFPDIQACPSGNDLGVLLEQAGFEESDINDALMVVQLLVDTPVDNTSFAQTDALRVYSVDEVAVLDVDICSLLYFLESSQTINALQRELIIHALMHLPYDDISLDMAKVMTLLVLWAHRSELPILIGDELMAVLHGRGVMQ